MVSPTAVCILPGQEARDIHRLSSGSSLAATRDVQQEKCACRNPENNVHHGMVHFVVCSFMNYCCPKLFIIGKRFLQICNMPGPAETSIMDGRMQKKIGNTSFTPTLAARSSAS